MIIQRPLWGNVLRLIYYITSFVTDTGKQWWSEDMLENHPPNISHLDDLMEEFLKLLLRKRRTRQLSSDSSPDTSPEPKKLRERDNPNSFEDECAKEREQAKLS